MTEKISGSRSPEMQMSEIYNKVTALTREYGEDYGESGKKISAVFSGGIDSFSACASVTLFSGHNEGEIKIIYESERLTGEVERVDLTFKQNGDFDERIFKSYPAKGIHSFEEIYRGKETGFLALSIVDSLLYRVEQRLTGQDDVNNECVDTAVRPQHKHLIALKRKVQNK